LKAIITIFTLRLQCFAIRADRKPLKKELIETMYEFHSSLLHSDFFEDFFEGENPGSRINKALFRTFADKYVEEQKRIGRNEFGSHLF